MRENRTSGSMSGERKRSDAFMAQATAPLLDSTRISDDPTPLQGLRQRCYMCAMANAKRSAKKSMRLTKTGKKVGRAKGGKLARVTIARPRIAPEGVDLKAVRKALRSYFRTHPEALE